jgi:hypothetical protein
MKYRLTAVILLLIFGWLQFSTLPLTSPTVDEPLHIFRGYAFVARGEDRYRMYGPVLSNALSGLALLLEPPLQLPPRDNPIWVQTANTDHPDGFIWENSTPPAQIFFLARLPIMAVSLLLGALIFRWASERRGLAAALAALTLYVFCPNILAHARLATTDVVAAATFFASAYLFQRALISARLSARLLSGVALGLALAAKFSAAALLLAYGLIIVFYALRGRRAFIRQAIVTLGITILVGGLTVWTVYRFKVAPVVTGGLPLPAPSFWGEWLAFSNYLKDPLPGYLFGQMSARGWWYYYPLVFVLKTPLPMLILSLAAFGVMLRARQWKQDAILWLPPGLFFVSLFLSPHDLGYRYLLLVLPFLFVASADVAAAARRKRWAKIGVIVLIGWQIIGTLRVYPYYLTFFNEIVGGADRGRYILSDSNLDWGQDLIGLKRYVEQQKIDQIKLSFFGVEHPTQLNLKTEALPPIHAAMTDQGSWWLHTYYPPAPAPGVYAISVANLMGGIWIDPSAYIYFRQQQPDAIIGGTIYVYTVPRHGEPADVSLGGLQVEQIDRDTFARFGSNDIRLRWFDATSSLIAPPRSSWVAIHHAQPIASEFALLFADVSPTLNALATDNQRPYAVYAFNLGARLAQAAAQARHTVYWSPDLFPRLEASHLLSLPISFGGAADLIGYDPKYDATTGELSVTTYWQAADKRLTPLMMFVHAVDARGRVVAQQDVLTVPAEGWRSGDQFAQIFRLTLPPQSGPVWLELGWYNPDTNERVPIAVEGRTIDRLLLQQLDTR